MRKDVIFTLFFQLKSIAEAVNLSEVGGIHDDPPLDHEVTADDILPQFSDLLASNFSLSLAVFLIPDTCGRAHNLLVTCDQNIILRIGEKVLFPLLPSVLP